MKRGSEANEEWEVKGRGPRDQGWRMEGRKRRKKKAVMKRSELMGQ